MTETVEENILRLAAALSELVNRQLAGEHEDPLLVVAAQCLVLAASLQSAPADERPPELVVAEEAVMDLLIALTAYLSREKNLA